MALKCEKTNMYIIGWALEDPPRGDPRPRPEIRGRGRGGDSILALGIFEVCPHFSPKFEDGAGTESILPVGDGVGRGHKLYSEAGTGRGGDRVLRTRRGRGMVCNPRKSPQCY